MRCLPELLPVPRAAVPGQQQGRPEHGQQQKHDGFYHGRRGRGLILDLPPAPDDAPSPGDAAAGPSPAP